MAAKRQEIFPSSYLCRFCKVLDGSKTGLIVRPEIFQRDRKEWQYRTPYWRRSAEEKNEMSTTAINALCGRDGRPPYVMDVISKEAVEIGRRKLQEIEKRFSQARRSVADVHLMHPWYNALEVADRYRFKEHNDRRLRDLKRIEDAVKHARRQFCNEQGHRQKGAHMGLTFIRRGFISNPPPERLLMASCDIDRLKASFAFIYDSEQDRTGCSSFAWEMAMSTLCTLKGRCSSLHVPNTTLIISKPKLLDPQKLRRQASTNDSELSNSVTGRVWHDCYHM